MYMMCMKWYNSPPLHPFPSSPSSISPFGFLSLSSLIFLLFSSSSSPLLRFTLTVQSLFQIKRQLDKLGDLVAKVTYESDPIPLQKPQMEERVKYLIYHLIKR